MTGLFNINKEMKSIDCLIMGVLFSLLWTACGDSDVDVTPPTMEVTEYTPAPRVGEICGGEESVVFFLKGGDPLIFDVEFKDNQALSQYKIDIHNNFDCHGHGGGSAPSIAVPNVDNQTTDWTVLDIQDIDGTLAPIRRTLNVPDNVTAGNYHYHIQVVDESGNDNPAANFFSLKIRNPLDSVRPNIEIFEPTSRTLQVKRGDQVRFVGKVSDERSLSDGGNGVVYLSYTDLDFGNTFNTNEALAFDENVEKESEFIFDYTIPRTLTNGKYRYAIGANDGVRNVAEFEFFEIEVTD